MADNDQSPVVEITNQNMQKEVLECDLPVIVDCWAPWCGPCLMIAPTVEEIAKEKAGKLKVGKLDVDKNMEISMKYGIRSIPTLLVFNKGQLVDQIIGAASKKAILKQLSKNVEID